MGNLDDFESIYEHLEENAINYEYPDQIAELFKRLRDLKHQENKMDEVEKAQWEIDFFNFVINDNILSPIFTPPNEKGEVIEYPNLSRFDERTYAYLIERLSATRSPLTKARYSHLLWLSPKKHSKYAEVAIDSYLELIKIYEKKDLDKPEEHYGLDVINALRNAFFIGCRVKYKLADIKSEIIRLINRFNIKSSSTFALRFNLIDLMLSEKKMFSNNDFLGIENICWELSKLDVERGNIHGAIKLLELGEKIDMCLNQKSKDWRKRIAEAYENLMDKAEDGKNLAAISFCQQALENYKKLKDSKKIQELEKRYLELKDSMELAKIEKKIDLTDHIKKCKKIASEIVNREQAKGIIELLMLSKDLLPKYKDMEKYANDVGKDTVIFQFIPEFVMDQRGHMAQHFTEQNEKRYRRILEMYEWEIRFNKIFMIREIFFKAVNEKKLSGETLLEFFGEESWFGKNLKRKVGNEEIQYSWLNLIAPSILNFFNILNYSFLNPSEPLNLVLSIDSLTLKLEGLLRDMCEFSGVATFFQTENKKRRPIIREKDLHRLLYEEKIIELFDEDDLLFFKYLLVEKAGLNLRHRIAHSLLYFQEYSVDIMLLLIIALLRIGKYDFVKKEKEEGE
jgi:ribosomal 50S subunit-associated protein YjgA (DUF615 family)